MLVLSRRVGETLVFPDLNIQIKFIKSGSNRTQVGISAPSFINIRRGEAIPNPHATDGDNERLQYDGEESFKKAVAALNDAKLQRHVLAVAESLGKLRAALPSDNDEVAEVIESIGERLMSIDDDAASLRQRAPTIPKSARKRALVVDDNLNEANLLASLMKLKQYDVEIAANGEEAIDYLENNAKPDVVLLDMAMPVMDGAETVKRIRQAETLKSLNVIVVSGSKPEEFDVDEEDEVQDWFQKPVDPDALMTRLESF